MSAHPTVLQNSLGRHVRLGRELGKGGEGAVYEAKEQSDYAVKIYWPSKAAGRREKIGAMVAAGWAKSNGFVAFPVDLLYSPSGSFVGFVMKRIGGHKPVHLLYSPSSRKLEFFGADFRFLIRAALNAARAVASVHSTGCVIGDINHSGFLVSDKATITLIDSDSFQVIASGKSFLCQVGTPEYTPPELQSSRFDRVSRTRNHDNFGLAILVFQLLFMGRHPYSGRFLGHGDMPLERSIAEFRFAYSARTSTTNMEPPPHVPLLTDFPDYVSASFEKAFGREGVQERPNAEAWVATLQRIEAELQKCQTNLAHHHIQGKQCAWCRMEQAFPGFMAFSSNHPIRVLPLHIDTTQVVAIINSIKDPGPTPDINTVLTGLLIVTTPVTPSPVANLRRQYGIAVGAAVVGYLLIQIGMPALVGLLVGGVGVVASFYPNKQAKIISDTRRQAESSWRTARDSWSRQVGNQKYLDVKREAENLIRELNGLPNEEKRGIQQLELKKRDVQLARFLERYQIKSAKIRKIGSGRKAVLASFSIETAADIETYRITRIQGFGPSLVSELVTWRKGLEQRFVFNASEPLSATDIAVVKAAISNKKTDLENRVRSAVKSLQQAASSGADQRKSLILSANAAFVRLKQAENAERAVHPIFGRVAKFVSIGCLVLSFLSSTASVNKPPTVSPTRPVTRVEPPEAPPGRKTVPQNQTTAPTIPGPRELPAPTPAPKKEREAIALPPALPLPPIPIPTPVPAPNSVSKPADSVIATPPPPTPVEVPSNDVPTAGQEQRTETVSDDTPKFDLGRSSDVLAIQKRLIELGYLAFAPDGKWGPRSARALHEFRAVNQLTSNSSWDGLTETRLFSASAVAATTNTLFVGAWTNEIGVCEAGGAAPLRITTSGAESAGGRCSFDSVRAESQSSWRVTARCIVDGASWPANIQLSIAGDRLTWVSEKGRAQYYRCQN